VYTGQDGNGWVSIETVLVRLNNSYAPRATFPVWGDSLVINGTESKIGYDAAVCVEVFEPYVLETFNSSALPYSTRIVGKTSTIHANFGDAESQGRKVGNFQDDSVHTRLNSSGLFDVFRTLHGNSVNIMLKVRFSVPVVLQRSDLLWFQEIDTFFFYPPRITGGTRFTFLILR